MSNKHRTLVSTEDEEYLSLACLENYTGVNAFQSVACFANLPCTELIWHCSVCFLENCLPQKEQAKGRSPVCLHKCLFKKLLNPVIYEQ